MTEGVKHLIISYLNPKNLQSTPWISSTHIDLDEKLQKPWNSLFMITVKILLYRFKVKIKVFKKEKNIYNTLNTMMETHWNAWKVNFFYQNEFVAAPLFLILCDCFVKYPTHPMV